MTIGWRVFRAEQCGRCVHPLDEWGQRCYRLGKHTSGTAAHKSTARIGRDIGRASAPFLLAASWELPFGHGKHFDITNKVLDAIAGGWAMNGALILQSGPPLSWGNIVYLGGPLEEFAPSKSPNAGCDVEDCAVLHGVEFAAIRRPPLV
jgi:hypothetical protein